MMMFWMLKPGFTIKSSPAVSQLHVAHRFNNPAPVPLFKALMKISEENKTKSKTLHWGDIYSSMFLMNCY